MNGGPPDPIPGVGDIGRPALFARAPKEPTIPGQTQPDDFLDKPTESE